MTTTSIFTYTINGVKIESHYEKLTAMDILEMAAEQGAIDGKPQDYILQSLKDDERSYKPEDTVDLSLNNEFIALSSSPTLVA